MVIGNGSIANIFIKKYSDNKDILIFASGVSDSNETDDNKFKREETKERNRSESSFSLKFKYEELIKDERELLLPPSYKQLLLSFNELDQTLNFFKMSSKTTKIPIFEDIKSSIENTFKQ